MTETHFIKKCSCGTVIAQCRCASKDKTVTVVKNGCLTCARGVNLRPRLCYVESNFAYFTTQDVTKQWGDDWNDVPYESNAGAPYEWRDGDTVPKWDIVRVAFESMDLRQPCEGHTNSPYSVEMINEGKVAWLESHSWVKEPVRIFAGTPIDEFIVIMQKAGARVFLEVTEAAK